VAAVPLVARRTRQDPRNGELLATPVLDAPAYKRPRRSNAETHLTPSYLPDIAAHSLSLCFAVASPAGAVLDAERVDASDHLGARRRRESEEEEHRSRSRTPPSRSASSTPRHRRRTIAAARR
jgi:hypothetical protein